MSLNCVNAAIELANEHEILLMLVASRRQIECRAQGGGYVNRWCTEDFARYVIDRDTRGRVLLARDHGGPWQNPRDADSGLSLRRAMESAKESYRVDLESGFQLIHIDPSIDIHGEPSLNEVLDRTFELYEYCWAHAQRLGVDVAFEVGTEVQSGSTNTQEELEFTLEALRRFCDRMRVPYPAFVVVQTGTRVMETRNVGSFDSPVRVAYELPAEIQVPKMVEICNRYDVFMKAHNTDYLSDEALAWHPRLGIHSANVAPQFGVAETLEVLRLLESSGLEPLADRFLRCAYESRRWDKWMLDESRATDRDRAVIAGHYVFATDGGRSILEESDRELTARGIDLNRRLKDRVKQEILRYLTLFRLVRPT